MFSLLSVVQICSNTEEQLTFWMGVRCSLISSSDLLNQWEVTHKLDTCSTILVSNSNLQKHWRATHILDKHSTIFVSGSEILICWNMERNSLAECMCGHSHQWLIHIIHSILEGQLTNWIQVQVHSHQWFCSSNTTREQLTNWIGVQPFLSVVLISAQTLRSTHLLDILCSVSGSDHFKHRRLTSWTCQALSRSSVVLVCSISSQATHSLDT